VLTFCINSTRAQGLGGGPGLNALFAAYFFLFLSYYFLHLTVAEMHQKHAPEAHATPKTQESRHKAQNGRFPSFQKICGRRATMRASRRFSEMTPVLSRFWPSGGPEALRGPSQGGRGRRRLYRPFHPLLPTPFRTVPGTNSNKQYIYPAALHDSGGGGGGGGGEKFNRRS